MVRPFLLEVNTRAEIKNSTEELIDKVKTSLKRQRQLGRGASGSHTIRGTCREEVEKLWTFPTSPHSTEVSPTTKLPLQGGQGETP
jgi:hypothetical protein